MSVQGGLCLEEHEQDDAAHARREKLVVSSPQGLNPKPFLQPPAYTSPPSFSSFLASPYPTLVA